LRGGLGGRDGSGHQDSLAQKVDRFSRLARLPCNWPIGPGKLGSSSALYPCSGTQTGPPV